jgi:PA domain
MRSKAVGILLCLIVAAPAYGQATFEIFNGDPPGTGFNDPTPATPVGGNTGTTVGEQRQIAFQYAADLWGAQLTSTQTIRVLAFFTPLNCTPTSAVLGAAAAYWYFANIPAEPGFPGITPNTWYPAALAEKRTNVDITANYPGDDFELYAFFNSNLGQAGCLPTGGWYYGLDTNTPAGLTNLVTVLLHEFGHGLGFSVNPTSSNSGVRAQGYPSVWEPFMMDLSTGKTWFDMDDAERAASARNTNNLVWTGPEVSVDAPFTLGFRTELALMAPARIAGKYEAQPAAFGPSLTQSGLFGIVMPAIDTGGASLTDGCEPLSPLPAHSVKGRIALIDRGTCTFVTKVANAQAAGAVGVIIANNVPSGLPSMGGDDPSITIPSIGITQSLGQTLWSLPQIAAGVRGGVPATLQLSNTILAGTTDGYPRLYAPNPYQPGSSVSHWDTSLAPNQLMEPFINTDLTHQLTAPPDLTFSLFLDIGW